MEYYIGKNGTYDKKGSMKSNARFMNVKKDPAGKPDLEQFSYSLKRSILVQERSLAEYIFPVVMSAMMSTTASTISDMPVNCHISSTDWNG